MKLWKVVQPQVQLMSINIKFEVPILWFFQVQFHQPRLVIRTFHRQGRCSQGGHLCNEHSEEKYSYK